MRSIKIIAAAFALVATLPLAGCVISTTENLYTTGDVLPGEYPAIFACTSPEEPTLPPEMVQLEANDQGGYAMFILDPANPADKMLYRTYTFHHLVDDVYAVVEPARDGPGQTIEFARVTATTFDLFLTDDVMRLPGADETLSALLAQHGVQLEEDGLLTGAPDAQRAFLAAGAVHFQTATASMGCARAPRTP